MWLPAEHAVSFPAAKPLPEDVDLRLPFPLVFAALTLPWRIEPRADHGADSDVPLLLYARGHTDQGTPPTLEQVLHRLQSTRLDETTTPRPRPGPRPGQPPRHRAHPGK